MKNIFKIFVFLTLFILLFWMLNLFFSPSNINLSDRKKYEFANGVLLEDENTVDIMFVGDSLVYSGISPLNIYIDYGFTSYNVSLSSQKLYQAHDYFRTALEFHDPKFVFLESSILFNPYTVSNVIEEDVIFNFDLLKYHDLWKDLFGKSKKVLRNSGNLDNKGYIYSNKVMPYDNTEFDDEVEISNIDIFLLNKIVNECKKSNSKLILLNLPSKKNWNSYSHDTLSKIASELNLDYYDLNELSLVDWNTDSSDGGQHLNYYGAKKVSSYLGEYIKNTDLVVDHRGDEKYASWKKAYDKMSDKLN